jgi:transcriptional regulator with XRE-family HTH domain
MTTLSDAVADQITFWRKERGWNRAELAQRCSDVGMPELTASAITNIESGRRQDVVRRRNITVDELLCFAFALRVSTAQLMPISSHEPDTLREDIRALHRVAAWLETQI